MSAVVDIFSGSPVLSHNGGVALQCIAASVPVFPCIAGGNKAKAPRLKGWQEAATTDEATVRQWWAQWPDALVGVHLAEAGLLAIDADRHGGPDGVAAWETLATANGLDRAAVPVVATPSDGLHFYFRAPPGVTPTNGEGTLPAGINVRWAGYTIAPGCILPDGRSYQPVDGTLPLSLDIPEAPQWLVGMIGTARPKSDDNRTPAADQDTPAILACAAAYLAERAPAIEGQGGDQHTLQTALDLRDMGCSEPTTFDLMAGGWNESCQPPWDLDELARKVENAFLYAQNPPATQSPDLALAGIEIVPPFYLRGTTSADLHGDARDPLEWGDEGGEDAKLAWTLKHLLTRPGVGIMFGAPKSGKSFAMFDLAARLTLNLPWFDVRTPKRPIGALLLLGEGAGTVRTRLRAFERRNGVGRVPVAWRRMSNLGTPEGIEAARRIIAAAREGFERRGMELGLIGVDSLASTLGLENENDAAEVTAALKRLEDLAVEFNVSVIGVHHAGLNGQVRGSSAFRASCDVMFRVQREDPRVGGASSYREIAVILNRYGEEDWASNFRLERVVLGIDEDGDEITSCVVAPAGESPAAMSRDAIYAALFAPEVIGWEGDTLPNGERGYTRKALQKRCAGNFACNTDEALRKAVERCEDKMIQAGRLKRVEIGGDLYLVPVDAAMGGDIAPASLF